MVVRWSEGVPALPFQDPDEPRYMSSPIPNDKYDFHNVDRLYDGWPLNGIEKCLSGIEESLMGFKISLQYKLHLDIQPVLKLDMELLDAQYITLNEYLWAREGIDWDPDLLPKKVEVPKCLSLFLGTIPVPREVMVSIPTFWILDKPDPLRAKDFLKEPRGFKNISAEYECVLFGLNTEQPSILGIHLGKDSMGVNVELPLPSFPKEKEEFRHLIASWSLTPVWKMNEKSKGFIEVKRVPKTICDRAFSDSERYPPMKYPSQFTWPK